MTCSCIEREDPIEDVEQPEDPAWLDPAIEKTAIRAIDFAQLDLGARLVGPRGPEVQTNLSSAAGVVARITSYVACPAGIEDCDPTVLPPNTIYTYVHIVEPVADLGGNDEPPFTEVAAFYMNNPAHGFMGHAGYARDRTEATGGDGLKITVTCDDRGALAWRVDPGAKDDRWKGGEPITFFWQSLLPPEGPAPTYVLRASGVVGAGAGPYPADVPDMVNICLYPEAIQREDRPKTDRTLALR